MKDNYAIMAEQARELFLGYEQEKLCARLGLPHDEDHIPLRFLDQDLRIRRSDGQVLLPTGENAGFSTVLSVYDILCRNEFTPRLAGQFVPTTALHHIQGTHSVHEDFHGREAAYFDAHKDGLHRACRALGGVESAPGDICYVLPVFEFFPCCIRFWESDEEFPASLQFLWDANALDFAHYETLFYMAGALMTRLKELIEKEA